MSEASNGEEGREEHVQRPEPAVLKSKKQPLWTGGESLRGKAMRGGQWADGFQIM